MSNDTQKLFEQLNLDDAFGTASANQGAGSLGEWPPDGEHDCYVTGISVTEAPFFQSRDFPELPGIQIQFSYQLVTDENPAHTEPLKWNGAPLNLPMDYSAVTREKSQVRARIELERLKGHFKTILGNEPPSIQVGCNSVMQLLEGDAAVLVAVKVKNRDGNSYAKEHLTRRVY